MREKGSPVTSVLAASDQRQSAVKQALAPASGKSAWPRNNQQLCNAQDNVYTHRQDRQTDRKAGREANV